MLLFLLSLRMSGIAWVEDVNGADCALDGLCVQSFPRATSQGEIHHSRIGRQTKRNHFRLLIRLTSFPSKLATKKFKTGPGSKFHRMTLVDFVGSLMLTGESIGQELILTGVVTGDKNT